MEVCDFYRCPDVVPPPKKVNLKGAILTVTGEIWCFDDYRKWIKVEAPYYAIGSGNHIAMGALANGATATEAVKAAAKHDAYTGFGIKSFKLK